MLQLLIAMWPIAVAITAGVVSGVIESRDKKRRQLSERELDDLYAWDWDLAVDQAVRLGNDQDAA